MKWNRLESTGIWADSTVQQPRPLSTHPRPVQDPSGNLRTVKVLQRYTILSQGTWYTFIKCHWSICEFNSIHSYKGSSCQLKKRALEKTGEETPIFDPETNPIQNHGLAYHSEWIIHDSFRLKPWSIPTSLWAPSLAPHRRSPRFAPGWDRGRRGTWSLRCGDRSGRSHRRRLPPHAPVVTRWGLVNVVSLSTFRGQRCKKKDYISYTHPIIFTMILFFIIEPW